jgi:hypothetical protein
MKKIVLDASELINIADISDHANVGIRWEDGNKCFVIQANHGFYGVDTSLDINGSWKRESIQEYIKNALKQTGSQAFCFNKVSELFKWMSE